MCFILCIILSHMHICTTICVQVRTGHIDHACVQQVFRLDTLLRAMGITLEDQVTSRATHTIRHLGLVIMLLLEVHSFEYGRSLEKLES